MRRSTPSGEQFDISLGDQRATVVEVGAGIRSYAVGDRPVLESYDVAAMCDGAHGAVLIPWPNRVAGGRYRFDDTEYQLDLSEPEKGNAIHGLLRWRPWRPTERSATHVHMATRMHPVPGYPFALDVQVAYELRDEGLVVRTTATNVGDTACPYGCGHHPYLASGPFLVDDCTVRVDAATRILTDAERRTPLGSEAVDGTPFDFRGGSRVGHLRVDDAFTDLARDEDGRAHVLLAPPDGATVDLWADEAYDFLQLYTGDTLAPDRRRRAMAAEPMTCAPDAFNNGDGLVRLRPGESRTAVWGVGLR